MSELLTRTHCLVSARSNEGAISCKFADADGGDNATMAMTTAQQQQQ